MLADCMGMFTKSLYITVLVRKEKGTAVRSPESWFLEKGGCGKDCIWVYIRTLGCYLVVLFFWQLLRTRVIFFDLQKDVQLDIDGNVIEESRCFFVLNQCMCG